MKVLLILFFISSIVIAKCENIKVNEDTSTAFLKVKDLSIPKYFLGSVIGGVGLINPKFIATNIFNNYELQLMAMHSFDKSYVTEMDLNYVLLYTDNFSHSIGLGGGYRHDLKIGNNNFFQYGDSKNFEYVGSSYAKLNYSLNWHFVFVQLGTAIGNNDYAIPRFTLQLGFLYHF